MAVFVTVELIEMLSLLEVGTVLAILFHNIFLSLDSPLHDCLIFWEKEHIMFKNRLVLLMISEGNVHLLTQHMDPKDVFWLFCISLIFVLLVLFITNVDFTALEMSELIIYVVVMAFFVFFGIITLKFGIALFKAVYPILSHLHQKAFVFWFTMTGVVVIEFFHSRLINLYALLS